MRRTTSYPALYDNAPAALGGPAAPGASSRPARGDHVHAWPESLQEQSIEALNAGTAGLGPSGANKILVVPGWLNGLMRATALKVDVSTLHASAAYCFGLYNAAGVLVLTTGAVQLSATGLQSYAVQDGSGNAADPSVDLPAGPYLWAMTASSTTGKVYGGGATHVASQRRYWGELASGGGSTLPATITLASITEDAAAKPWIALFA